MIDKIGVEAEIGTYAKRETIQEKMPYAIVDYDGSIKVNSVPNAHEIQFKPHELKDLDLLKKRIIYLGEFLDEINKTMGFHIHLSFKNYLDYTKLLSYEFFKSFISEYKIKFGQQIEKSRLRNFFCKLYNDRRFVSDTSIQLASKYKDHRYFAVNYNSYNIHDTIEFRIFPMTQDANRLVEYLDFTINFVSEWLRKEKADKNLIVSVPLKYKNKKIQNKKVEYLK